MLHVVVRPEVRDGLIVVGLSLVLGPALPDEARARDAAPPPNVIAETLAVPLAGAAPAGLEWLWAQVRDWLERANSAYQERVADALRKPPRATPPAAAEPAPAPRPAEPLTIAGSPEPKDANVAAVAPVPPPSSAGSPSPPTIEPTKPEAATPPSVDVKTEGEHAAESRETATRRAVDEAEATAREARAIAERTRDEERRAAETLESEAAEALARAEEEAERRMISEAEQSAADALDAANARLAEERRIEEERAKEENARRAREARELARATEEALVERAKPTRSATRSEGTKKRAARPETKRAKPRVATLTTGTTASEPARRRKQTSEKARDGASKADRVRKAEGAEAAKPSGRVVRGIRANAKVRVVERHPKRKRQAKKAMMRVHVVRDGETLSRIAWMHYRSGRRYVQLHRANRSKIKNPDLIFPGQKLAIPVRSAKG